MVLEFLLALTSPIIFFGLVTAIAVFLLARRRPREALFFLGAFGMTMLGVIFLKTLFAIPRPPHGLIMLHGYSFPSGHASGAAFLALSIFTLLRRRAMSHRRLVLAGTLLSTAALLVGLSRLYLGVHTPYDVGAGFVMGLTMTYLCGRLVLGGTSREKVAFLRVK